MNNTPNSLNQSKSSQPSKWDTVSNVDYDPDRAERLSKTPLRRKAEIAKSLIHENQDPADPSILLSQNDIESAYRVAMHSKNGLVSKEIDFIQDIDTPLGKNFENSTKVYSSLGKQEQKILAFLSGVGFDNYTQGNHADLNAIVNRHPSPATLIPKINNLFEQLTNTQTPTKVQEYINSYENFKDKIYGERNDYSKAFDELYQDAEKYYDEHNWAQSLNAGRPTFIFDSKPSNSKPLEQSQYHNKALDDQSIVDDHRDKIFSHPSNSLNTSSLPKLPNIPRPPEINKNQINLHGIKIINSLLTGKHVTEVDDTLIDPNSRKTFADWIKNGQLTPAHESQFLQSIAPPMQASNGSFMKTFNNLTLVSEDDPSSKKRSAHAKGILAFASDRGFDNRDQVDISDMRVVLAKYPTPVEFQAVEDQLLDNIRRSSKNSPTKVIEYQKDFEFFKQNFYGKRQEYHEAWQELEEQARENQAPERAQQPIAAERPYHSSLDYQPPEVRAYYESRQNNSIQDQSASNPTPKKGVFGKLFGRKK